MLRLKALPLPAVVDVRVEAMLNGHRDGVINNDLSRVGGEHGHDVKWSEEMGVRCVFSGGLRRFVCFVELQGCQCGAREQEKTMHSLGHVFILEWRVRAKGDDTCEAIQSREI